MTRPHAPLWVPVSNCALRKAWVTTRTCPATGFPVHFPGSHPQPTPRWDTEPSSGSFWNPGAVHQSEVRPPSATFLFTTKTAM